VSAPSGTGTNVPAPTPRAPQDIAAALRRAILDHPAVRRLDGGTFGVIATYAPGQRLIGVRVIGENQPVEIGVVLGLDRPLPEVADELRTVARRVVGDVRVDVTVCDVTPPGPSVRS